MISTGGSILRSRFLVLVETPLGIPSAQLLVSIYPSAITKKQFPLASDMAPFHLVLLLGTCALAKLIRRFTVSDTPQGILDAGVITDCTYWVNVQSGQAYQCVLRSVPWLTLVCRR